MMIVLHTQNIEAIYQKHYQEMCEQENRHTEEVETMRRNHLQQIMRATQTDMRWLVERLRSETAARRERHREEDQQLLERQERFVRIHLQEA